LLVQPRAEETNIPSAPQVAAAKYMSMAGDNPHVDHLHNHKTEANSEIRQHGSSLVNAPWQKSSVGGHKAHTAPTVLRIQSMMQCCCVLYRKCD